VNTLAEEGLKVIEGAYFRDLLAQPQALNETWRWLCQADRRKRVRSFVTAKSWRRIVLTGMGSSFHTLHPLYLSLISSGQTPVMIEASELIHYAMDLCDRDTLVIAVSQSGESVEILRLLEQNQDATVLGVTNTADSTLAKKSQMALISQAGPESFVSSKTYLAGMMVLQWLASVFADANVEETLKKLEPAGRLTDAYLHGWRSHVQGLAASLGNARHAFFLGRGASLAAAGTGALIVKESAHFHSEAMSSAAFRHGPMEMLQSDMFTAVFAGSEATRSLNQGLVRELTDRGVLCEEIGSESTYSPFKLPSCDPLLLPILELLPIQMVSLALAALDGREAGRFEHGSKITNRE
jgi:glucosamine--fructose-6-phosphate aminotransferase (isomerizing)